MFGALPGGQMPSNPVWVACAHLQPCSCHKYRLFNFSLWLIRKKQKTQNIVHVHSASSQTEFLCKPLRRIMKEKSMTRKHGGGIIGRGIIEKESLRREASGRHLGNVCHWEASGSLPDASQNLQGARELQEAQRHKNQCHFRLECKSLIKMLILHFLRVISTAL